jgi:hypothetical protein
MTITPYITHNTHVFEAIFLFDDTEKNVFFEGRYNGGPEVGLSHDVKIYIFNFRHVFTWQK